MNKLVLECQIQSCQPMKEFQCQTYFARKVPECAEVETSYFMDKKQEKESKIEKTEGVADITRENLEEQKHKKIQKFFYHLSIYFQRDRDFGKFLRKGQSAS